ncbi:MAG: cysteine--tRNA ligase [Deltaproteobacteria bacterium]|jgi:cysteinyl-tRNA synthetase|nr:cysteine--tRNA ligase [Deltaproteobacteria bacterium]
MNLRVFNTLKGQKELFDPIVPGKVSMYVCGVTVYDYCHMGHARANIVFDIVFRYLQFAGYDVTYVRNYTDIDDKIINRANERGIPSKALAEEFIQAFDLDMEALGLRKPTHEPRATEYVPEIIALVKTLIEKGLAYEANGDVYFSIEQFPNYLCLSKRNMEEMLAGARIAPGEQKQNPMDFALWKAAKPGEPSWDSPWGAGRPGWHIECSAMSSALLGDSFDIHGGGRDLIFPHHENEIAQSEGATGKPFVKYWLHNGFVNVDQEKMSKSLGNFFTIRDILEKYDPEIIRFFVLTAHYRSPIDFSDQNLNESRQGLTRFYEALHHATNAIAELSIPAGDNAEACQLEKHFRDAMDDDFNTALAIGHLFDGVRTINRLVSEKKFRKKPELVATVSALHQKILELGDVLGLFGSAPAVWLKKQNLQGLNSLGLTEAAVEELIKERLLARQEKDFARADQIRESLAVQGVELLDSPQGTTWKIK